MYFIHLHENRKMKPVEIILNREEGRRENDCGNEPNQRT
jgi:hypothetical protein